MTPKDVTFKLVKSLTPSEKRYFQLFASITEGEKNYLLVFEEMDKMTEYNESIIKKKYKDRKLAKNLTFEKLYLQKMILKALRNYHSNDETSYVTHFADVEILMEKGIPELLEPLLKKYKKLTEEKDQWVEHLLFCRYEYKNAARMQDSLWFEKNLEAYSKHDAAAIEQLQISSYLKNNYNLMILLMRRDKFSNPQHTKKLIDTVFNKKNYEELKPKLNKPNAFHLNLVYNTYLTLSGQMNEALQFGKKELQKVYDHDDFKQVGIANYLLFANNHAKNALTNGMFSEGIYHANKMYEVLNRKENITKNVVVKPNVMNWFEIIIMANTLSGNFQAALNFCTDNKNQIAELGKVGGKEFRLLYSYYKGLSAFGLGRYNETLDSIGDVKDIMQDTILVSEVHLVPILYIMAHLELESFQYLENFLRSTKRYYSKQHVNLTSVAMAHKIFGEYIRFKHTSAFKNKCEEWLKIIFNSCADYYEHNFIRKLLLRQWLLSKYHNLPMEQIVKDDVKFFGRENRQKVKLLLYN